MKLAGAAQDEISRLVQEYCTSERNPTLLPFIDHGTFTQRDVSTSAAANLPGCYAIYSKEGALRYIGMSEKAAGYRALMHFSKAVQASPHWVKGPATYVQLVEVISSWEAPSLESYLTVKTKVLRTEGASSQTTEIGTMNKNRQVVRSRTDRAGTDHGQRMYMLQCGDCGCEYGANGSDIWLRHCPRCQSGKPGI